MAKYKGCTIRDTISKNIKKYRTENNLTQKQFAELFNVKSPSVSHWEVGDNSPDIDTLFEICNYFKIDINRMCGVEPIEMELSLTEDEYILLKKYRQADDITKKIILKVANDGDISTSIAEKELINAYRKADDTEKTLIERVAGIEKKIETKTSTA